MDRLSNFTFDEIEIGQTASYGKRIEDRDVEMFAAVSGDVNPVHLDEEFAAGTMFRGRIAHGMLTGGLVSAALAMRLPGPGTVYLGQSLRFSRPVRIDDEIEVRLEVTDKKAGKNIVILDCRVTNQDGEEVAHGEATVLAPTEKIIMDRPAAPVFKRTE